MTYKVKNIRGTSNNVPQNSATWLEYWEKHIGEKANCCYSCGCYGFGREGLVGAHVQLCSSYDKSWYIVPLCRSCNQRQYEFMVNGPLAPVNE